MISLLFRFSLVNFIGSKKKVDIKKDAFHDKLDESLETCPKKDEYVIGDFIGKEGNGCYKNEYYQNAYEDKTHRFINFSASKN